MTKLEWNRPGSRLFENGIDQAVLFVDGGPGIPWSGLIGLANKATSGDKRDVYIDGVKANSEATIEEYLGTLEAYYFYPTEFEVCDGIGYDMDNLVRVGQQPRRPFHLALSVLGGQLHRRIAVGLQDPSALQPVRHAFAAEESDDCS